MVTRRRWLRYAATSILGLVLAGMLCTPVVWAESPVEAEAASPLTSPDVLTPICSALPYPITAIPLSDGSVHLIYELLLTNWSPDPLSLADLKVVDPETGDRVLAQWDQEAMAPYLRHRAEPDEATTLSPGEEVAFLAEVALTEDEVPTTVAHELTFATPFKPTFTGEIPGQRFGEYEVSAGPVVIGLPFEGDGWTTFEYLSSSDDPAAPSHHRTAIAGFDDRIVVPQRFAIDWMRVDENDLLCDGDPGKPEGWVAYGAPLVAVADGTVVEAVDRYPDSPLPYDESVNGVDQLAGNRVVLDIGGGNYVLYAHLRPGSVTVQAGHPVTRGDVLGELGHSGNSTAPHLHFHVMDRPSASGLGAQGVPFVFDSFSASDPGGIALGENNEIMFTVEDPDKSSPHTNRAPLNLTVIGETRG